MKKYIKNTKAVLLLLNLFILLLLTNCSDNDGGSSGCNPSPYISRNINMGLPLYSILQTPGGWVYVAGEATGTNGIIVVNTGRGYKAYDRNPPHICPNHETTLIVKNDIEIVCPYDDARWILSSGEPIKGANKAPRTYYVAQNGNSLYVSN